MHFSHLNDGTGGKAGKLAVVAGLHALVAMGVINVMNSKAITLPALLEDQLVWIEPQQPPPPPPTPPKPQPRTAPPEIVVPKTEVELPEPPPVEQTVQATTETQPMPAEPTQNTQADVQPTQASSDNSGQMRTAVLADANGCAKPDYPARAARNGETGTVTLALLVGANGRVQDARIQSSSGSRDLDRAALNALSMCQFKPAMNNGVPEAGWGQIAYVWTLE